MKKAELNGNKNNNPEELKEQRIQEEFERISSFYSELDKNKKAVITPILQNAAFMRVTLEDLQQLILEEGVVDQYQNGENQHGKKQSAALQSYNALVKNYAAVSKTLTQMLPPERKPILPNFIMGKALFQWRKIKEEEQEKDPLLCFVSFEDWLKQKAAEYAPDPEEDATDYEMEWLDSVKRTLEEEDENGIN